MTPTNEPRRRNIDVLPGAVLCLPAYRSELVREGVQGNFILAIKMPLNTDAVQKQNLRNLLVSQQPLSGPQEWEEL